MSITSAEPLLRLEVKVGPPSQLGDVGVGMRRLIPITGGRVSGAIQGEILSGGADWQTIQNDGTLHLDAHYAIRTTNGAVVEVISTGVRAGPPDVLERLAKGELVNPAQYYFRTAMRFRSGAPELAHINQRLFVSRGERRPSSVYLEVFEVL